MKQAVGPGRRSRRWLGHLMFLALILGGAGILHWLQPEPLASSVSPVLAGDLIDGGKFDLEDHQDRPILVHFWATWCPVCRLGDGTIDALAKSFDVITVAIRSGGPRDIREHMSRESLSFPVIPDPQGELTADWGVTGVPANFILDGDNRIRFVTVGYTTGVGLWGRLWITRMLD